MEIISIKHGKKFYKMGDEIVHAIDDFTFDIDEGKFISIIGPSGSGKSTLLHVLGGLDQLDEGELVVNGQNLRKLKDDELANFRNKTIGFVFQNFNLQNHLNSFENIELPLILAGMNAKQRKDKVNDVLNKVGLQDRKAHKPNELSGGQQQRVSIARAIINNPKIILADEPTGNLDTNSGGKIINLLKKFNKDSNITVIVVTHDNRIAQQSDGILRIQDGKLKENIENGAQKKFISRNTD